MELTKEQMDLQDTIDNATHAFLDELVQSVYPATGIDWDIDTIGQVRDVAIGLLKVNHSIDIEYPYIK